jgi:hypothetical protein
MAEEHSFCSSILEMWKFSLLNWLNLSIELIYLCLISESKFVENTMDNWILFHSTFVCPDHLFELDLSGRHADKEYLLRFGGSDYLPEKGCKIIFKTQVQHILHPADKEDMHV